MEYGTEGSTALAPVAKVPARPALPGGLAERIRPVNLAGSQRFDVADALAPLLPEGLPYGSTISVAAEHPGSGGGATSLALALVARASQAGAWVGLLGLPQLGLVAADELAVCLERLVLVDAARSDVAASVAAMIDGFDLVLLGAQGLSQISGRDGRRLLSRLRERSGSLVCVGSDLPGEPARTRLRVTRSEWSGLGQGSGHLRARRVRVLSTGRGAASRSRQVDLWLPGP